MRNFTAGFIHIRKGRSNAAFAPTLPIIFCLLCGSFCLILNSCSDDSPSGPSLGIVPVLINRNAVVIPGSQSVSLHGRDGSLYIIYDRTGKFPISKRDIIVGSEEGGYMRHVLSLERKGLFLYLETSPACLTDLVRSGRAENEFQIGFGSPGVRTSPAGADPNVSVSGGRLVLTGFSLYSSPPGETPGEVTITSGYVEFEPTIETGITISGPTVRELYAAVKGALTFSCDISASFTGDIDIEKEVPLASIEKTSLLRIGSIPVVEKVTLTFSAAFTIRGASAGGCTTGTTSVTVYDIAMAYSDGGWSDRSDFETDYDFLPFECDDFADAEIGLIVKPAVDISFFSSSGAEMEMGQLLSFSAETESPPFWSWELTRGTYISRSFDPSILDRKLPRYAPSPLFDGGIVDSGPYSTDRYIFVLAWGSEGEGDHQFRYPRGIACAPGGDIYVSDSENNRIGRFGPDSSLVYWWGSSGGGAGRFNYPCGLAIDASGDIYVADRDNHRVQKFGPDGSIITAWGSEGTGEGLFISPEGISVAPDGTVYVVDGFNNTVQRFTPDGLFLDSWGVEGSGAGELKGPVGIAIDAAGTVYISEYFNDRVQKFTPSGVFISGWGSKGGGDGMFDVPIALAAGPDNDIFVVDFGNNRVQRFDLDGAFLGSIGYEGSGDGGFIHPAGIAVSPAGLLFVTDTGNYRVQKFAPKP